MDVFEKENYVSNYNHDDVCDLNSASVDVIMAIGAALKMGDEL